jgi:glycosyltransferase involved in cell wall biosynthesis
MVDYTFSIVIVAKDSANVLPRLLDSLKGLTDDIVVCDSGSKDQTPFIASDFGAKVHHISWEGYGRSKNTAVQYAKYEWVLSMDSDEKIDQTLYNSLKNWKPSDEHAVYQVRWKNFIGNYWIKNTGGWKSRLFNKKIAHWNNAIAHEDIISESGIHTTRLNGFVEHYSHRDFEHLFTKYLDSAMITAQNQHLGGKKSSVLKIIIKPIAAFFRSYLLRIGFQNGFIGLIYAFASSYYTFLKYTRLYELNKTNK